MLYNILTLFCLIQVFSGQETPTKLNIDNFPIPQDIASFNFNTPGVFQITPPIDHAEGPTWDGRKNIFYFVNIRPGMVFSYNYESKLLHSITLNGDVTPVIPAKNNHNILIVGLNRTLVALEWDGEKELGNQKVLLAVSPQFPDSRFNDGKADRLGRVWIGTLAAAPNGDLIPNEGIFFKVEKNNLTNPVVEIAPVNISNGLAWNKANNKLYYIDSPTRQIVEYDFDEEKGNISNRRVAVDITKFPTLTGDPDGMTIDDDDNLWIALYGGGAVIKANPKTGQLLQVIPIPARDVTSAAWGGPNFDILFVTTSRRDLDQDQRKEYPSAGSVFAVTNLETKGRQAFYADLVDTVKRNLLDELLSPAISNNLNDFQKNNIHKKHTSEENFGPEDNKPLWMTMIERIRSLF